MTDRGHLLDSQPGDNTRTASLDHQMPNALHRIVETVTRTGTDGMAATLNETTSARDQVEIITAEEVEGPGESHGESKLRRVLVRLQLNLGSDLDELAQARHESVSGHALIQARSHEDEEQVRIHAILGPEGGYPLHYFGRWTIHSMVRGAERRV
jgi:hypothetical protein